MKVFVSWSGRRSQGVAEALATFLTKVIQSIDPFISTALEAGVKWNEVIAQNLDEHGIGILCVTPGNVEKPWLNFEAGALSRHLEDPGRRVVPYLLDFHSAGDLKPPLSQFNAVKADQEGTWKLVQTLNGLDQRPQPQDNLKETFQAFWTKFEVELDQIRLSSTQPAARRSDSDKLDELLTIGNQLLRRNSAPDYDAWYRSTTSLADSTDDDRFLEQWLKTTGDRSARENLRRSELSRELQNLVKEAQHARRDRTILEQLLPQSSEDAGRGENNDESDFPSAGK